MEKVYGSPVRQDGLYKIGRNKYELIYGFGKDNEEDENGWNYRERFTSKPTFDEVKSAILGQINADTDHRTQYGYVWNGMSVLLNEENKFNFKAAYDLAVQTSGATLPITFKLGDNEDGTPNYHTFETIEEFTDFYTKAMAHVVESYNLGWQEKDSIDWELFDPRKL